MYLRIALMAAVLAAPLGADEPDFYAHWGDGRAEISSYDVVQPRYGELRHGHAVLIYVTEELNRRTAIKVESPTPEEDRVYVLKLNHVLKFTTGIYPYSVMTSVFSAVEGMDGQHPFELVKLSLTSQEWCGQVFDQVLVRDGALHGYLNSYFESEGVHPYELPLSDGFASEDHLLVQIRELRGPFMQPGEERQVELLPTLWWHRLTHQRHALAPATLRKGDATEYEVNGQPADVVPWTWTRSGERRTVYVEAAYPHRILGWDDSNGGSGTLKRTIRVPYWRLNGNEHAAYRDTLGLP